MALWLRHPVEELSKNLERWVDPSTQTILFYLCVFFWIIRKSRFFKLHYDPLHSNNNWILYSATTMKWWVLSFSFSLCNFDGLLHSCGRGVVRGRVKTQAIDTIVHTQSLHLPCHPWLSLHYTLSFNSIPFCFYFTAGCHVIDFSILQTHSLVPFWLPMSTIPN